MNSNDATSPTSPNAVLSNTSSEPADSPTTSKPTPNPLADLEVPLLGLVPKLVSEMTEQEMRDRVLRIQQLRTSSQTFQAALRADGGEAADKSAAERLKNEFSDYI